MSSLPESDFNGQERTSAPSGPTPPQILAIPLEKLVIEVYRDDGEVEDVFAVKSPQNHYNLITKTCLERIGLKYDPWHENVADVPSALGVVSLYYATKDNDAKTWDAKFWVVETCPHGGEIALGKEECANVAIGGVGDILSTQSKPLTKEQQAMAKKKSADQKKRKAEEKKEQERKEKERRDRDRNAGQKGV